MTEITVYQDEQLFLTGFDSAGHAGYAESGEDIVCSAISALVITCVNSVEALTEADSSISENEEEGIVIFRVADRDPQAQLLLKAFLLGVTQISEAYPGFANVTVLSAASEKGTLKEGGIRT